MRAAGARRGRRRPRRPGRRDRRRRYGLVRRRRPRPGDPCPRQRRPDPPHGRGSGLAYGRPADRALAVDPGLVRDLAAALFAAEACGTAAWALDTAVAHAKTREQFGRPIGQFQAVKHLCADMLVRVEQARALTWDAARAAGEPTTHTGPAPHAHHPRSP
ncbi:acyl-CoA dehydrogenase family protein [Streptomyces sp. FXJ1.4098]|nr:acyl-CoA dehydrogenase family protein [Streptomyces sp. FXJ1.4098]